MKTAEMAPAYEELYKRTGVEKPFTDFDRALDKSRRAFEALRYPYEKQNMKAGEGWMGYHIQEGIRERILQLMPSWAR
jgi:hypothetical protein